MTDLNPRDQTTAARGEKGPAPAALRRRGRPETRPRRKSSQTVPLAPPDPTDNIEHQGQTVSIELRPVSGLFGRSDTVEITGEDEPSGLRRLRSGLRRRGKGEQEKEAALLHDPDFRLLWWSRLLSQTAQGALLYALMILVIDLSNRSFYSALFVACSNIPSILLGLPAGMVVDNISRKVLLVTLNGFRFTFMLFMVATEPSLGSVFAATLGIWIIHQFYSPSEASLLADLVRPHRYTSAQSMFNLALTISQALGLALLAPLTLRIGGAELVFVLAGSLWLIAGALTMLLPSIPVERTTTVRRRGLVDTLTAGLQFVRRDRPTLEAILHDVLVSVGMSALVVIIPFYLENVLGTSKENTVFVFAPAAIGLVLGLRMAPALARIIGETYTAFLAVTAFAVSIFALGFVDQTYAFFNDTLRLPLDQVSDWLSISPRIFLTMLVSIPAGMAMSVVNVAARSILLQRTPGFVRGQVIATQGLIGNVLGLVPTLLTGLAADFFGVIPVAVGIAVLILAGGVVARSIGRSEPPPEMAPVPAT